MKVGVNLLFLVPGEVGGSEPLLTNLVRAMMSSRDVELVVYGLRGITESYPWLRSLEVVEVPWTQGAQGLRIAAENSWLAFDARRRGIDVMHHGVGTTPFVKTVPTTVTVHDIQYRHYPENFSPLKRTWLSANVPQTLRGCRNVCVPSQWVRQDLMRSFGITENRVHVVPFGSEDLFGDDPAGAEEVIKRYDLAVPYVYFPGRTYPHKNHVTLLRALAAVEARCTLVLTGAPWPRDAHVIKAAKDLGLQGRIRHLGQIPRRDLAGLFEGAAALTYPTRFEGFGAPVLEAMSVGCPVIASDVTAVPEVAGDAAVLLDPDDIEAWGREITNILVDEEKRLDLSERGRKRAAAFTWDRSAALQIKAYQDALDR